MPFFSIIIPTFNRANSLIKAIDSIFIQRYEDLEIIVVDDGSTDDTESMIKSKYGNDQRVTYWKIQNSERGAARNFGFSKASGKYINYFDSDDVYCECFEALQTHLTSNDFPDVVYGIIRQGGHISTEKLAYKSFDENLIWNNFMGCGSVFLKFAVAARFPFNEDRRLASAEDWELWLRVRTKFQFAFVPLVIFELMEHPGRSILSIKAERIEERDLYFADVVSNNIELIRHFGTAAINLFAADRYTFIALAAVQSNKAKAWNFLYRSIRLSVFVTKRKRFWAVLKKLVWQ
jgi:glycosyltransferase involved in cell wall biosynthesis